MVLKDWQLLAYMADDASPEVVALIESDQALLAQAQALAVVDDGLKAVLPAFSPPTAVELADYEMGLMPAFSAQQIKQYLKTSVGKQHANAIHAFAKSNLPTPASKVAQLQKAVTVWMAKLVSAPSGGGFMPALSGIRGTAEAAHYQAGDVDIMLDIAPDETVVGCRTITGSLVASSQNSPITQAKLWQTATNTHYATPIDEFDDFHFASVPRGTYTLTLIGDNVEIHIQAVIV